MNTKHLHSQRGGAMIELVILMMAAAYVIHLMLYWTGQFSKSEGEWARAAYDAHKNVGHTACLETVQLTHGNRVVIQTEGICTPL